MATEASKTSLVTRIDTLALECGLMSQDLDKIPGRLGSAETCISDVEDTSSTHNRTLTDLQRQVNLLKARSDDAEKRLHRNNERVVGLPEGMEGDNPATFAESWSLERVSPAYQVERAHRVPTGARIPGAIPRSFLVSSTSETGISS